MEHYKLIMFIRIFFNNIKMLNQYAYMWNKMVKNGTNQENKYWIKFCNIFLVNIKKICFVGL